MPQLPKSPECTYVESFLSKHQILVRFDGSLYHEGHSASAHNTRDLSELVARKVLNPQTLLDQLFQDARASGLPLKKPDLASALRLVIDELMRARKTELALPLFLPLSEDEAAKVSDNWKKLGSLFNIESSLAIAILQHFVWSVKRKISKNPVTDHCMPIIYGRVQGSGKTTFVRRFLAPLEELATDAALLSDIADKRSADIFRFPVVWLDDMEPIARNKVAVLKGLITAPAVRRRLLMTSMSVRIENEFTPIGTSNVPIHELVPDSTGHRRFAMMPLRTHDGIADPLIWETVNEIDFSLLWRSVDALPDHSTNANPDSPIKPFRAALRQHQQDTGSSAMIKWFRDIDLDSEHLMNATSAKGVTSTALRLDYQRAVGENISQYRFKQMMDDFMSHPASPFSGWERCPGDIRYALNNQGGLQ